MNLHMKTMVATSVAVCSMVVTPVYALENGAFTTSTTTNYINPDTGTTDDGGTQNAAIGEGMCRSIIDPTILIEVEEGKVYATVRVHLYANMPSVDLKIQGTKGDPDSYYAVSHSVMQEDFYEDFADLRFEIPNVGTRIQCTAYVTPMGREVCFYFDIASDLTAYSGTDFIVSVDTTAVVVEMETVAEEVETETEEVETETEEVETETEEVETVAEEVY
ncbi:MAG: heme-binding Shp domain-containing protein, partial [Bacillota bacterium]